MDKCHIQGEGTQKETKRTKSGGINTLKELEGKKKLIIIETAKVRELNQEKERGRAGKNNTRIRTR